MNVSNAVMLAWIIWRISAYMFVVGAITLLLSTDANSIRYKGKKSMDFTDSYELYYGYLCMLSQRSVVDV